MRNNRSRDVEVSPESTPLRRNRRNGASNKKNKKKEQSRSHRDEKGLFELFIFCAAIACGTACSISSKVIYDLEGIGSDGTLQKFDKPLAQTLGMFLAMVLGLPIHWFLVAFKIPFPGYEQFQTDKEVGNEKTKAWDETGANDDAENLVLLPWTSTNESQRDDGSTLDEPSSSSTTTPLKTYFYLCIPAVFDLTTTALCMVGLVYLDVSIYQLLRGSGIIFTALIRTWALKQPLYRFQWLGVLLNVVSVILVGMTALLDSGQSPEEGNLQQVIMAILIMLLGTLVQSMQFVFEEKVMVQDEVKVPPLLLFGMEGVWCVLVLLDESKMLLT